MPPGYNRLSTNVIAVRQGLKNQPTSALFGSKSGIENLIAFLHKSGATRPQTTLDTPASRGIPLTTCTLNFSRVS